MPDAATAKAENLPAGADVYDILKAGGWTPPASSHYDSAAGTFKSGGNCDGSNRANCWTKGGKIIKFSVYDPVPFSDYWENAALMSQELQPLGMDVTTKPAQGYSDWNTNITSQPAQLADGHPLGQRRQHPVHPVPELARQHRRRTRPRTSSATRTRRRRRR